MIFRNLSKVLIILFFFLNSVSVINTKPTTGIITGVVKDKDGNLLPGVTVTIKGRAGDQRSTITNSDGIYRFPDLPPGEYSITVALSGFKTIIKEKIFVGTGKTELVDFILGLGTLKKYKEEVPSVIHGAKIDKEEVPTVIYEAKKDKKEEAHAEVEAPQVSTLNGMLGEEINQLSIGKILSNTPKIMRVGIKERIEVQISQNVKEDLTKRLRGTGFPQVEEIIVGSAMKVKLSGDTFKIESFSDEQQPINSSGYAQWEWDVTPLKSGNRLIHLSVSVSIHLDKFGEKTKSLPVMDKEIYVKVNLRYSFCNFIKNNWQWFVGTIIALLGLYLGYIKSKKRRQNHGS